MMENKMERKEKWMSLILVSPLIFAGCSLELSVDDLNSKLPQTGIEAVTPSFQNSQLKMIPDVSSVPIDGEVKVQYCIRDKDGNIIERKDFSVIFELKSGAAGTFSSVTYNEIDKCYESTFKGESVGSAADIVVKVDQSEVPVESPKQISVATPLLSFTGNSVLSPATIDNRIVTNTSSTFTLTGTCEPLLGNVEINGAALLPQQIYTTPCAEDHTFSFIINAGSTTAPYFSPAIKDPMIQARQGSTTPQMTRIMYIANYPLVKITNAAELQSMTVGNLAAFKAYVLMNDIDLTSTSHTALGTSTTNYWRGIFYGEGHKISNLTINQPAQDFQALIGFAKNASINDLQIENATITGKIGVAAVLGKGVGVSLARVSATGATTGVGYVGMIVGHSWDSDIKQSWATGTVTGGESVGGIAGYSSGGDVINSWADVNVSTADMLAGGLIGLMDEASTDALLENSFSMGSVTALEGAAGLTGGAWEYNAKPKLPILKNSFSLSNVSATSSSPTTYLSGLAFGHAGSLAVSPYVADPQIQISGLYHLSGATCNNCGVDNSHSTPETLPNILNWTKTIWDYTWTWKIHSSGSRPDLINNPKP